MPRAKQEALEGYIQTIASVVIRIHTLHWFESPLIPSTPAFGPTCVPQQDPMPGTAREIDACSVDLSQGEIQVYRKERRGEDPPVTCKLEANAKP